MDEPDGWCRKVVSLGFVLIFAASIAFSAWYEQWLLFTTLAGVASAKAGTIVDYQFGSASSGRAKDATIASELAKKQA